MRKLHLIIAVSLLLPTNLYASSLPDFPFIGVQGSAKRDVQPDIANIGFGLIAFSEDSEQALNTIKQKSAEILKLAGEFNIPNESIVSMGIDNEIKREVNREQGYNRTNILGYEVSQSFSIKIIDTSKYSAFVDRLIATGNIGRISPNFDVSNRKEIERSLVAEAGKDAKQKAEDLANAMNVKIKSVYAINQDTSFEHFFARFGLQEQAPSGGVLNSIAYDRTEASMNMMVPKAIQIKKNISVVYKIK